MKNLAVLFFSFLSIGLFGQVTSLDYLMKYNCETDQYDVHLVIKSGSANSIIHRAQFNSQISIVVPTGESVEITEMYMPLQDNFNYDGTIPLIWSLGTPVVSPTAQPENDFYGVTPTLAPAALYNDLETGEVVKLFSFTAGETGQYNEEVRFFLNGEDPSSNQPGMGGGDFSNSFTMGGSTQIYNSNSVESCLTDVEKVLPLKANIYPNPFQNQFTVELPNNVNLVNVMDAAGRIYYRSESLPNKVLTINSFDFAKGVHFIRIELKDGSFINQKLVKF